MTGRENFYNWAPQSQKRKSEKRSYFTNWIFGRPSSRSGAACGKLNELVEMEPILESTDDLDEVGLNGSVNSAGDSVAIGASSTDQSQFEDDEDELILRSVKIRRKHGDNDEDSWWKESEAEGLGQYDDFHTIDWCRDRVRDRIRYRKVRRMKRGTLWERIKVSD